MKSLGLCLGASTISAVVVASDGFSKGNPSPFSENGIRVVEHFLFPHEGNPKDTLLDVLERLDLGSFDRIAATGRKFRDYVNLTSIAEPEAVEYAYQFVKSDGITCPAVISAGGESFMAYLLDRSGRIANVLTGNKCASGTGEFLLQQLRRLNVSLEEAFQLAATDDPHPVSGRCSVFCKSDCTHATNKGIPKAKVIAGLCKMMANKILELLKKVERRNIMITGGTALNRMMVAYLRQEISGLIVPDEAPYFEALGAALWSIENKTIPFPGGDQLFKTESATFDILPPLRDFTGVVEFKTMKPAQIKAGDECILGLDVGSTTTKAILMRTGDDAMLASIYLRTDGDPVGASRRCYRAILKQIMKAVDPEAISVIALGVCGSGRQIAGLHALTDGVINEIIAHSTAAVYFDPEVDTLFEIGGQDAKYTYITNSVPSDYAMNEACSAGTGSFLEESALETLGVEMADIADLATRADHPPNFNDQCAAFISSDIKNAIHEGLAQVDIVAGLVYSICMNYANRVKGNRPVGAKVFMQGGVCYNRAVPLAMAALVGKPIVVPPEPGLMGAFGVALAVKKRLRDGLLDAKKYDLEKLADREVNYKKKFVCQGGRGLCDRRCEINMIELEGKRYPFGGACNRYDNLRQQIKYDVKTLDLVKARQRLVFEKYGVKPDESHGATTPANQRRRIGFNRSFLVNTYYPLYAGFFDALGFEPVVPAMPSQDGIDRRNAAFCYPGELAHGFFQSLLDLDPAPEYIFLPHFKAVPLLHNGTRSQVCPLVQGETFYLRATFRRSLQTLEQNGTKVLTPLLDFTKGVEAARPSFVATAEKMGVGKKRALWAFDSALDKQRRCLAEMRQIGQAALLDIESNPDKIGVVLFGRPYNAFVEEAHMGIPRKFASRGVPVIPVDFLSFDEERAKRHMYWGMGQIILKAARTVKQHAGLFGTFITNFSCGPDSLILSYFRDLMGQKPSLTLELDSHTADAGLDTRIEAFLDIVTGYRRLMAQKRIFPVKKIFRPASLIMEKNKARVVTSAGRSMSLRDPRVKILFPSMGRLVSEAVAAMLRGNGFDAICHPPADEAVLKLGRQNTTGKECLPLILTTGALLNYSLHKKADDEVLVYFMPTGAGPCRFGQYYIFMEDLVKRMEIADVALLSLSSENAYVGLGDNLNLKGWRVAVISDVMEDIRSMLLANAKDVSEAMAVFEAHWQLLLRAFEHSDPLRLEQELTAAAERFSLIPMKMPPERVPKINLTGEIFVRRDALSRQYITEFLAKKGFAVICSPICEWIHYTDYLWGKRLTAGPLGLKSRLTFTIRKNAMRRCERRFKSILSRSGLVHAKPLRIDDVIQAGLPHISDNLQGEAILTIGGALTEIVTQACGVIAIGPFGCMPNRLSEAILREVMNRRGRMGVDPGDKKLGAILAELDDLPFLAIESDGSPFPQLIHAQLEAFCLRAARLHNRILEFQI